MREAINSGERVRLMRDGAVHALGLVMSSVAGLLLVPIMVRGLGPEQYGLWMSAVAAVGVFGAIDLGLRMIIIREIAGDLRPERAPLVRAMLWLHLLLGILAGTVVALGGGLAIRKLQLSQGAASVAPIVFLLGGISCFFDQVFLYVGSVWAGLRKFALLNSYTVAISVARIALFWAALAAGHGLRTIATLNVAISAISSLVGLAMVFASSPDLRPKAGLPEWKQVAESLGFGAFTQAATSIASLQLPLSTLLISVINGAAAVTPFTIGQKFPNLISGMTWRTSEVYFPVASRQHNAEDIDPQQFLQTIHRWLVLTIVPAALGLILIAPALLRAWMGSVDPIALAIVRIASASVIVEIFIPGAIQLFWGAGRTGVVLAVNLGTIVCDVALAVFLLPRFGPAGASWATLISTVIAAGLLLVCLRRERTLTLLPVFRDQGRLVLAVAIAVSPAYFLQRMTVGQDWMAVLGVVTLSVVLYLVILWTYAASSEEKALLKGRLRS